MTSGDGHLSGGDGSMGEPVALESTREQTSIRSTYHRLRMVGFSSVEAGNLTAHLNGLHITGADWTLPEIEGVLFVRALVQRGRILS